MCLLYHKCMCNVFLPRLVYPCLLIKFVMLVLKLVGPVWRVFRGNAKVEYILKISMFLNTTAFSFACVFLFSSFRISKKALL